MVQVILSVRQNDLLLTLLQRIPLVSDVIWHARGDLVARLDEYQYRHSAVFEEVTQGNITYLTLQEILGYRSDRTRICTLYS